MARINIEDKWWTDSRRGKLIELLKGNSREADGLWFQMCRLSQTHCEKGLIPLSEALMIQGAELLFDCDLLVLVDNESKQTPSKAKQTIANAKEDRAKWDSLQAYVRGSEEQHGWLAKRKAAGRKGGGKSAKRTRDERGRLQANTKQTEANPSTHQASSSSSSSSSSSYKNPPTPQIEWQAVKSKHLAQFPQDGDRLEGALKQIKREGRDGDTIVRSPVGYIAVMWPKIRNSYDHHDKPKPKVVKEEEPINEETNQVEMKKALNQIRMIMGGE